MFKFAAVLLLLSWPANAEDRLYYTFSEWARLQDEDRIAYISGLLDACDGCNGARPEDGTALQPMHHQKPTDK
jgi:hypothetical protein